jgi:ATP-dependent DNA ligase
MRLPDPAADRTDARQAGAHDPRGRRLAVRAEVGRVPLHRVPRRRSIELVSRKLRPLGRYFPELLGPLRAALPDRCVVDGEIVVADVRGRGLDFDALLQRIHPAESRINRLAVETPAAFVAFDLLALGDTSLLDESMSSPRAARRRGRRRTMSVHLTPATTDRRWPTTGSIGSRAPGSTVIVAKPLEGTYQPGKRAL